MSAHIILCASVMLLTGGPHLVNSISFKSDGSLVKQSYALGDHLVLNRVDYLYWGNCVARVEYPQDTDGMDCEELQGDVKNYYVAAKEHQEIDDDAREGQRELADNDNGIDEGRLVGAGANKGSENGGDSHSTSSAETKSTKSTDEADDDDDDDDDDDLSSIDSTDVPKNPLKMEIHDNPEMPNLAKQTYYDALIQSGVKLNWGKEVHRLTSLPSLSSNSATFRRFINGHDVLHNSLLLPLQETSRSMDLVSKCYTSISSKLSSLKNTLPILAHPAPHSPTSILLSSASTFHSSGIVWYEFLKDAVVSVTPTSILIHPLPPPSTLLHLQYPSPPTPPTDDMYKPKVTDSIWDVARGAGTKLRGRAVRVRAWKREGDNIWREIFEDVR